MELEWIRHRAVVYDYRMSAHAVEECEEEGISLEEIHQVLLAGEILEQYGLRKDIRGDSCLLLGYGESRRSLHVVVAYFRQLDLLVVTAYCPKPPKWVDERTRGTL